jgi:hypothetical protein
MVCFWACFCYALAQILRCSHGVYKGLLWSALQFLIAGKIDDDGWVRRVLIAGNVPAGLRDLQPLAGECVNSHTIDLRKDCIQSNRWCYPNKSGAYARVFSVGPIFLLRRTLCRTQASLFEERRDWGCTHKGVLRVSYGLLSLIIWGDLFISRKRPRRRKKRIKKGVSN